MFWVAVLLACTSPEAVSCNSATNPNLFSDRASCEQNVREAVATLIDQGMAAIGGCNPVRSPGQLINQVY